MEPSRKPVRLSGLRGGRPPSPLLSPQEAPRALQLAPAIQPAEPTQDELIRIVPPSSASAGYHKCRADRTRMPRGRGSHSRCPSLPIFRPGPRRFDALGDDAVIRLRVGSFAVARPVGNAELRLGMLCLRTYASSILFSTLPLAHRRARFPRFLAWTYGQVLAPETVAPKFFPRPPDGLLAAADAPKNHVAPVLRIRCGP
jgi:hypothetical protein